MLSSLENNYLQIGLKMHFKTQSTALRLFISVFGFSTLTGCAVAPKNLDSLEQDTGHSFIRKVVTADNERALLQRFSLGNTLSSSRDATQHAIISKVVPQQTYTRGDVLRISFMAMPSFNGLYQINENGRLELPFSQSICAAGLSRIMLVKLLKDELVRLNWFYKDNISLDVSLVRQASVNVSVTGAVFVPGLVSINNQPTDKPEDSIQQISGEFADGRNLLAAISAAGGVRPDADLNHIYLKRNGSVIHVPLSEIVLGAGFVKTPTLINGDAIFVRSSGTENPNLITPTPITPPGMRVFMSNLTAPALNNAQAAVGADSTRLPYGSSLLDAAISANCIGGTHQANASRSIILLTKNYGGKQQMVVRRSINQLLANSSDYSVNPYVMPNDGLACYDSRFTNFRDVARGVGELISPLLLGKLL